MKNTDQLDVHVLQAIIDEMNKGKKSPLESMSSDHMDQSNPDEMSGDEMDDMSPDDMQGNPDEEQDETDPRLIAIAMKSDGNNDPDEDGDDDSELMARLKKLGR